MATTLPSGALAPQQTQQTGTKTAVSLIDNYIKAEKYIFIGEEELFVRSKTGNKLTVDRGRDNTKAAKHVSGAEVKGIDYTETTVTGTTGTIGVDSALIEEGDNFGFDGGHV